jgi:ligand-binding SRPBCC domain-containing protein
MRAGTLIDYRLSLFGVPFDWRTEIEAWEPEVRFVDVQLRGPYARWHHTHTFADAPGGTLIGDTVEYRLPLGPLGELAHALLVRRQLATIFEHRRRVVEAMWGEPSAGPGGRRRAHGSS